jgi:hypothetical protein
MKKKRAISRRGDERKLACWIPARTSLRGVERKENEVFEKAAFALKVWGRRSLGKR